MFDVLTLALQTDSTRVVAYIVRDDLNGGPFLSKDRSVPWDLHTITHHGGDEEKLRWWTKIDAWQMEEWVYFLDRLSKMREGTGTVLDRTLALWGTTNGGSLAHDSKNLTALLTGGKALGIKHAGHVPCENQIKLGNLMRTITEAMGVKTDDRFYNGEHTGTMACLR
jgi:hypothetical protein